MNSPAQIDLNEQVPAHCCPYCKKEVGYLGRALAWLLGDSLHGCDFSNVREKHRDSVRFEKEDGEIVPIKASITVNEPPLDRFIELQAATRPIYKAAHARATRNDTLDEIARWHDLEAKRISEIETQNKRTRHMIAHHHISAQKIRAMKSPEEQGETQSIRDTFS